ncbi:phosphodiester glycosidase family protein, partial [Bacillus cereus]|nr:phosphodiester glycosidase family protein [Bacillus cereus]
GKAADYAKAHLTVGQTVETSYHLRVKSTGSEVDPSNLQMMIGGHTILVTDGQKTSFSRSTPSIGGTRARTALGYSRDKRYAYVI